MLFTFKFSPALQSQGQSRPILSSQQGSDEARALIGGGSFVETNNYDPQTLHPIRTMYPNKIIVSNKLLGLLGLGSGLGFGSGFILYA